MAEYWTRILNTVSEVDRKERIHAKIHEKHGEIKTRACVISHLGLGDMFWMNGAVRYISTMYDSVTVICKKRYEDPVKDMYRDDPTIIIRVIEDDPDLEPFDLYKRRLELKDTKSMFAAHVALVHEFMTFRIVFTMILAFHEML